VFEAEQLTVRRTPVAYLNMRDPHLLKYYYKFKTLQMIDREEISGSSPPDIFVGRVGYPNVYVGPLVPPIEGDTSEMGMPETWVNKTIPEIVEARSMLVRGMLKENVHNVEGGRVSGMLQELAIADRYTGVDMRLARKPNLSIKFDENSQPFGPSAPLREMSVGNTKANRQMEKAYFDTSMDAATGIIELYEKGVEVSRIQKILAAGGLGIKNKRKFVPTRWSITAVDDTLGRHRLREVKQNESIEEITVFEDVALDNRWLVLLFPGAWSYELVEAWYPNTTWNQDTKEIAIFSSSEFFEGRKGYAEIGGCYYAARLAVSEYLDRTGVQARAVILRETHPGYIMPVGVWNVREHVRAALKKEPLHFDSVRGALDHIGMKMAIPVSVWIKNSDVLRDVLHQRTLA
jgi:hypothetical protein